MTIPIEFLTLEDVMQIHEDQVHLYGGSFGVRDPGLLQSAIAQPEATFAGNYLHQSIFHMAAAYLFHLCENHPFHDGNKRTAAMCCFVFLSINGYDLRAPEPAFEALVMRVAQNKANKEQITQFLQTHSTQIA